MASREVCIAGAGIIGLSLALELHHRGVSVVVLERDAALSHASIAAAGMLAAEDPDNPPALKSLALNSLALYPEFLARVEALSGVAVPYQTSRTFQAHPTCGHTLDAAMLPQLSPGLNRFLVLDEHSLDPRQLATALLSAVRQTTIDLREHVSLRTVSESAECMHLDTSAGPLMVGHLVHTSGAWSFPPVTPRKGQMLSVSLPSSFPLRDVIRTPEIYIVPRTCGPRAGQALIGATIEEAGFDTTTHAVDMAHLRSLASLLLPEVADERLCPTVDQWAGLRPATPDGLPLLGRLHPGSRQFVAAGHYRNGILLAPATAHVMAELLLGQSSPVDLTPFAVDRFAGRDELRP